MKCRNDEPHTMVEQNTYCEKCGEIDAATWCIVCGYGRQEPYLCVNCQ